MNPKINQTSIIKSAWSMWECEISGIIPRASRTWRVQRNHIFDDCFEAVTQSSLVGAQFCALQPEMILWNEMRDDLSSLNSYYFLQTVTFISSLILKYLLKNFPLFDIIESEHWRLNDTISFVKINNQFKMKWASHQLDKCVSKI